jgi:hypothetical protein
MQPPTERNYDAVGFSKPDFVYLAKGDIYRCPAGEKLEHHFTADEDGQKNADLLDQGAPHLPGSRISARRPTSAASSAGNTNTLSRPRRRRSIKTRKPCVCAAKPSSNRLAR